MMTEFATTVLLPVFFREEDEAGVRMLRRALDSIFEQNFPGPFEVLIVDDGSHVPVESHASQLVQPAKAAKVRFLRSPHNGGLVHALNRGLSVIRTPFVARLDADDRWLPTKIEKQFAQFAADPDLTINATGMTLVDAKGVPIEPRVRPNDWDDLLRFTGIGCPFPHGSVLARREIFDLLGGYLHDPDLSHCEDYALWAIWLRFFKPAMIEEALYEYTMSELSISSRNKARQTAATEAVGVSFARLKAYDRVPQGLQRLAAATGLGLIAAGRLAYRAWRYRPCLVIPESALEPLQMLLPDRIVRPALPHEAVLAEDVQAANPGGRLIKMRIL